MRRHLPLVIVATVIAGALSLDAAALAQSAQAPRPPSPPAVAVPVMPAQVPATAPPAVTVSPTRLPATTLPAPAIAAQAPSQTPPMTPPSQSRPTTPPPPKVVTPPVFSGQTPMAPPAPPAAASPMSLSSWQNVRLEFTITDTFGSTPTKKTVSMLVVDRGTGRIRSSTQIRVPAEAIRQGDGSIQPVASYQMATITINIDANVTLPNSRTAELAAKGLIASTPATAAGSPGQILLNMTVQYTPDASYQTAGSPKPASLDESLNLVVQDGKPTLVSQSADPQGERKVTLEVTATVVK